MINKMKNACDTISKSKKLQILILIVAAIFSCTVLAHLIPQAKFVKTAIEQLQTSQNLVGAFSASSISASLALNAIPTDFANSVADTLCGFNSYFIFMFVIIFAEKLLLTEGIKAALIYIIPAACALYVIYLVTSKESWKKFSIKLFVFGSTLVLAMPISLHITEVVCDGYMDTVNEAIDDTEKGAQAAEGAKDETGLINKLKGLVDKAVDGISGLTEHFNHLVEKCIDAIAILILKTFVLPLLLLALFQWLLKELFSINMPDPNLAIKSIDKISKDLIRRKDFPEIEQKES